MKTLFPSGASGYRPNSAARSLRSGRTGRLLLLTKDASRPFWSSLISGAGASALKMGYDLFVQQTEGNCGWKDRLIELAATRAVDGVITSVALKPWEEFSKPLSKLPLFSCDQAVDRPEIPGVYIDHLQSTLEGLEHLYGQGCRTIACVYAPYGDSCASSSRRMAGYKRFDEAHSDVTVTLMQVENDRINTGYALVARIRESETPIDGIFAGSDEMAAGVLQAAREADISLPDELRVLGFDDQPISEIFGISTVRQPIEKMGSMAAVKLIEHVEAGDRKKAERYRVKHRLIQRKTT